MISKACSNDNEILTSDEINDVDEYFLEHYGMPRRSGRYPWGSGEDPFQHGSEDFLSRVDKLKSEGMSEEEIRSVMKMSTTEFRDRKSIANAQRKQRLVDACKSMHSDGINNVEIGKKLGLPESTVRNYLKSDDDAKMMIAHKTALFLKEQVDNKQLVDIGTEVERTLGVSKEKMRTAVRMLEDEGYKVFNVRVEQMNNAGKYTTIKVLATPDKEYSDAYANSFGNIKSLQDYTSHDGGDTFTKAFLPPASLDSKRVAVRYAEEGGEAKDGLVEIRRGVKDIELDGANYSQVRILVDGTHYIKGMACYSDDVPEGYDMIFNTNKKLGTPMCGEDKNNTVLKQIKKDDPDNPFGSAIKPIAEGGQHFWTDENGVEHLSVINKRADEGDWDQWSKEISSQMLSKQPMKLINQQLNQSKQDARNELDEINSLTNPTIKKAFLEEYAENADSAAVELKAARFANSKFQVIMPLTSISDKQCYAPNYEDGTELALIRYPHAGTFEIPIVTVNNSNREGVNHITPDARDAIGISAKTAARLSGADFDGDTVMVIPITDKTRIKSTNPLAGLEGFDPKMEYGSTSHSEDGKHFYRDGREYKIMTQTQKQMGMISNLITDMTLGGATDEEKARAVRHSMVVIDAEKHKLDYEKSFIDNGIQALKDKYQGKINPETGKMNYGASTLISSAKSEVRIRERAEGALFDRKTGEEVYEVRRDRKDPEYFNSVTGEKLSKGRVRVETIDPTTGEKLYHDTNRSYRKYQVTNEAGKKVKVSVYDYNGEPHYSDPDTKVKTKIKDPEKIETIYAESKVAKMDYYKDARSLISKMNTPQEQAYADYANYMKSLANEARKTYLTVEENKVDSAAKKMYASEVESLNNKLNVALQNAPKERIAQATAKSRYDAILKENPSMDQEHQKKLKQRLLVQARTDVGASRENIKITEKEWEAIQSKAVSPNKLSEIIRYSDKQTLRALATPKSTVALSDAKIRRIASMTNSGYTNAEIAKQLGVSVSTVLNYKKGDAN